MAERAQGVPKVCPTYLVHAPLCTPPPCLTLGVHKVCTGLVTDDLSGEIRDRGTYHP